MHVHRGLLGWGVFFIVLGAVPVAAHAGVVGPTTLAGAWQLWPLLLIGAGVGLVLARTSGAIVGRLTVAVTAGLMGGAVLVSGIGGLADGFARCGAGPGGAGSPFPEQRGTFREAARVSIQLDCGAADIKAQSGAAWRVAGTSHDGRPPNIDEAPQSLAIRADSQAVRAGLGTGGGTGWQVTLPRDPLLTLDVEVNAGAARAILDGLALDRVAADVNAGSAFLDLGAVSEAHSLDATVNAGSIAVILPSASLGGSLTANAGSISICAPPGVDLRFHVGSNQLGSDNFEEAGLVPEGSTWSTPGYGDGAHQVELSTTANLGSINLNPAGGCG
jgi:hypothetical protein